MLEVRGVVKHFGGMYALNAVDLEVREGEILGLIGPNGAGKSSLFNVITGVVKPESGSVIFKGEDITGLRSDEIAHRGIGRTFQDSALCLQSTVFENVFAACHMSYKSGLWHAFCHSRTVRREEKTLQQKSLDIIEYLGLMDYKDKLAANLSSGYQKALAICVAFATSPKLLLLDEPATTLAEDKVKMIMEMVSRLRHAGTTVIIIEHNMKAIMDYCDKIAVLAYGRKIAEGLPDQVRENKDVIEAYLGVR